MLRIQKATNGKIVFRLSGRIEAEDVSELRRLFSLESSAVRIVLNLKELVLVDGDAVEFLAGCEAAGMTLNDCPAYVRTWIDRGRGENK
jgi:anti-anti-sigma regulatory factor